MNSHTHAGTRIHKCDLEMILLFNNNRPNIDPVLLLILVYQNGGNNSNHDHMTGNFLDDCF